MVRKTHPTPAAKMVRGTPPYGNCYAAGARCVGCVPRTIPVTYTAMPDYRRANAKGGTYFFTVTTHRRQPILTDEPMRAALRKSIGNTRKRFPFEIVAWVLLPDHLHCIWTLPDGDADFHKRWGMIKRQVSQACGQQYNRSEWQSASRRGRGETSLWQRRYWEHQIRDETDMARHVEPGLFIRNKAIGTRSSTV